MTYSPIDQPTHRSIGQPKMRLPTGRLRLRLAHSKVTLLAFERDRKGAMLIGIGKKLLKK